MTETQTVTQTEVPPTTATEGTEATPEGAAPTEVAAEAVAEAAPPSPLDSVRQVLEKGEVDLYDLEETPVLKKHLERRDRQQTEEITQRLQTEYTQKTANWEATEAARKIGGLFGTLEQKVEAGDIPGAERILDRLEVLGSENLKRVIEFARAEGRDEGATQEKVSLSQALTHGFDRRMKDDFQDALRPGMTFEDGVALHDKLVAQKHKAELQAKDDIIERLKTEGRTDKGPNLAASSGGGAAINSYEEASRRYNLPVGHPEKITHEAFKEQRARFGIR